MWGDKTKGFGEREREMAHLGGGGDEGRSHRGQRAVRLVPKRVAGVGGARRLAAGRVGELGRQVSLEHLFFFRKMIF